MTTPSDKPSSEEVDDLVDTLRQFTAAYPESIFGPVTDAEIKEHGNLISRNSAAMGRHCATFMGQAADMIERLRAVPECGTPKPQSSYEPLTREQIERIRVTFQAFSADADQAKRLTTLCDMALNAILFSLEIDRLRSDVTRAMANHNADLNASVSATQLTGAGEPSKVPPPSGMALSMLDVPTRVEATVRDLRDFACGLDVPEERELVQHAADMLEIAARSTSGALDWGNFDTAYRRACETSEPTDWMHAALMAQQVRNGCGLKPVATASATGRLEK